MPVPLDPFLRSKAVRYLLLDWQAERIADELHCSAVSIYRIQTNMWRYKGSPTRSRLRKIGRPRDITVAARKGLEAYLYRFPIASQYEMRWFLWEKYGIAVSQPTICRALKDMRWSRKKAQRVSPKAARDIMIDYKTQMVGIHAE